MLIANSCNAHLLNQNKKYISFAYNKYLFSELPCEPLNFNRSALIDLNPFDDSNLESCPCTIGTQVCPASALGPPAPKVAISSADIVYNMTGRNISDWLIKTRKTFYKQRYFVVFG